MVKIRWANSALDDLQLVHAYACNTSGAYADHLVKRLIARTDLLLTFPRSGRQVPEFSNPLIRELVEGNYRIVCRVINQDRIDITRVHHSAQPLNNPG